MIPIVSADPSVFAFIFQYHLLKMSVNDKDSTKHRVEKTLSASPTSNSGEVDGAWKFLDAHRDVNIGNEPIDILAIRRKIDYRVVPLGFLLYMMQFADKLVVNVSP